MFINIGVLKLFRPTPCLILYKPGRYRAFEPRERLKTNREQKDEL